MCKYVLKSFDFDLIEITGADFQHPTGCRPSTKSTCTGRGWILLGQPPVIGYRQGLSL